jgi:hypothetical protein
MVLYQICVFDADSKFNMAARVYVKTLSADGGHLGWRSGSLDIILKVDHLRTIHAMFALNNFQNCVR